MKLYAKLMLNFGLLTLVAFGAVLYIAMSYSSHALKQAIGEDLQHICQADAATIDDYIEARITDTKIISQAFVLRRNEPLVISAYFTNLQKQSRDYSSIIFVNPKGLIIASSSPELVDKYLSTDMPHLIPYFDKATKAKGGQVYYQDYTFNKHTQAIEINFLTPIIDEKDNRFVGVLVTSLRMDRIREYVLSLQSKTPGDKAAFLVNDESKIIITGDHLAKVGELSPDAQVNPEVKAIARGDKDGYLTYKDYTGEEVLAGYADLKPHGVNANGNWQIFSVAPIKIVLAPVNTLRDILIITTFITFMIVLIISFFIAKIITTPLKLIAARINEIANAAGDLTAKIDVNTNDEIGDLARAFNKMLGSIKNIIILILNTAEKVSISSQQLSSSAQQLTSTTEEIAAAVQQIAKGSQNQAQQVQETSQVIEQMNASVEGVASESQSSAATSVQATEVAIKGGQAMQTTMEKINSIYETVSNSSKVIQSLGARSDKIGEIVRVITHIADQTNLLALNAAIEAARAGEAGRGFAVVADEVRKLAEGSAKAADQITDVIRGIQEETLEAVTSMEAGNKEVNEGREVAEKTSRALEKIIAIVKKTADSIQQIAISADDMASGTKQVVKSIEEVAASAEQSAAGAEQAGTSAEEMSASMQQIAASSQELSEMAMNLRETVKQFRINNNNSPKEIEKQPISSTAKTHKPWVIPKNKNDAD